MNYSILNYNQLKKVNDEITIIKHSDGYHPAHSHDFIEIIFVAQGKGVHIIDGRKERMIRGDIFIINSNITHEYFSDIGHPVMLYNYIFPASSIDMSLMDCNDFVDVVYHYLFHTFYTGNKPQNYIRLSAAKSNYIETILLDMYNEYINRDDGFMQILKSDLIKLLISIFRLYKKSEKDQNNQVYKQLIVNNAIQYMKDHCTENISCEKLARLSYLSLSYFSKIFKELTGMSIIHMLQQIRIEKACDLIKDTTFSIQSIANMVGYNDIKYFYSIFRQFKHVTPGEYRGHI